MMHASRSRGAIWQRVTVAHLLHVDAELLLLLLLLLLRHLRLLVLLPSLPQPKRQGLDQPPPAAKLRHALTYSLGYTLLLQAH
jgi:hypothetical protein